jgi:integrase
MGERLTKRLVDAVATPPRRITVWDSQLSGFGLRLEPTGAKTFIVRYRAGSGGRSAPERLVTIGRYGTLTPEQARTEAKRLLASVKLGADPAVNRRRGREMPTFGELADRMLAEAAEVAEQRPREARLRSGSIRNYKSLLRLHLGPAIGRTKLDSITTAELARMHRHVGKTMPATANRCMEFVGSVYKYATTHGLVPAGTNPARGVAAFKERKRERFLTGDELARLGEAIREGETIGIPWELDDAKPTSKHAPKVNRRTKLDPDAAAALRLLILTGGRLREILHSRWADVDLERGVLFVEGKTGRRPVILPPPALLILSQHPRRGSFVFPGISPGENSEKPRSDLNRPWRAVARRAKLHGVRLHDLRHSFASFAAAGGASLPIIGKLLGHTQAQTTSRYSHLADDPLRVIADKVGATVAAALEGKPPAEQLQLRKDVVP